MTRPDARATAKSSRSPNGSTLLREEMKQGFWRLLKQGQKARQIQVPLGLDLPELGEPPEEPEAPLPGDSLASFGAEEPGEPELRAPCEPISLLSELPELPVELPEGLMSLLGDEELELSEPVDSLPEPERLTLESFSSMELVPVVLLEPEVSMPLELESPEAELLEESKAGEPVALELSAPEVPAA